MRGFRAMIYKETIHILRDPRTLVIMLLLPGAELAMFGYAVNFDVRYIETVVLNQDGRSASHTLMNRFWNTETFRHVATVTTEEEFNRYMVNGKARVGIRIPPDYTDKVLRGAHAQIQVLIDGSNSTVAMQALNVSNSIALKESVEVITKSLGENGKETNMPVETRPSILFNPDMKTANFLIPGLVAVLLHPVIIIFATTSLVREKEEGTLEQIMVTPISRLGIMMGKLLPYLEMSAVIMIICFLVMRFLFKVPFAGSPLLLGLFSIVFMLTALGVGLFISTFATNQLQAVQISFMFSLPSDLLSGFVFPHEGMPTVVYWFAHFSPLTYYIRILRGIIIRGAGFSELWPNAAILLLMATTVITISTLRFKKTHN